VLVTGATGFIGGHLVAGLARNGVDVRPVGLADADLRDPGEALRLLDAVGPSTVVNLARPTHAGDSDEGHAGHVEIAANLLAASHAAGVRRLIHLGSSTEYGSVDSPAGEDAPLRPTTPFGAAKAKASSLVLDADGEGIRTVVLRPFSVYGPGDLRRHLIPAAIEAALSGTSLPLAAGVERDWVFVRDVAEACALALDGRADGLTVNLASGATIPNERVIELVREATGREIAVSPDPLPARPWDVGTAGTTELARRSLRWRAGIALSEGIRETVVSHRLRPTEPDPVPR